MEENYNIKCLQDNEIKEAMITADEQDECYKLALNIDGKYLTAEADNYFYALVELRKKAEAENIKILCKGCCKNVYPSPMILSMGDAIKAYTLTLNQPAVMKNLVEIFDPCELDDYATVEEQEVFYNLWINSITKKDIRS